MLACHMFVNPANMPISSIGLPLRDWLHWPSSLGFWNSLNKAINMADFDIDSEENQPACAAAAALQRFIETN